MNRSNIFWQTYLNLEKEVLDVSKYIYITDTIETSDEKGGSKTPQCYQLKTYSPYLADLLVTIAIQIESISKEIFFQNGGKIPEGGNPLFDSVCLKFIDDTFNIGAKIVKIVNPYFDLRQEKNKTLTPLLNAGKGAREWQKAYQNVKHDRYNYLHCGNIKNILNALGALFLLNIYLKNDEFTVTFEESQELDFSFGSKIFTIMRPCCPQLYSYSSPEIIEQSPFIFRLDNKEIEKFNAKLAKGKKELESFVFSQPEFKNPDFCIYFENEKRHNPSCHDLFVLIKYRLEQIVNKGSTLEERKQLLITSRIWKSYEQINNSCSNNIDPFDEDALSYCINLASDNYDRFYNYDNNEDIQFIKLQQTVNGKLKLNKK